MRERTWILPLVAWLWLAAFSSYSQSATYHVGHAPGYDFNSIYQALQASSQGDEILVAPGDYSQATGEHFPIRMKPGVSIKSDSVLAYPHIIGDSNSSVIYAGHFFDFATELEGFVITGGAGYRNLYGKWGGGIYCEDVEFTIKNCIITGNTADTGGGIACASNGSPAITNCVVHDNFIIGFFADGGGVYLTESSPILTNCIISYNSAEINGGGVYCLLGYPEFFNCTISENLCLSGGGAMCILSSNPGVTNSILWQNSPDEIFASGGNPVLNYCDIEGDYAGTGNFSTDPMFVNPGNGNFHLQPGSPCIDTGTNSGAPGDDIDGQAKPNPSTGVCDIGADEFYTGYQTPTPSPTRPPDTETPTPSPTPTATETPTPSNTPTPIPVLDCDSLPTVACGGFVSGTTVGAVNFWPDYDINGIIVSETGGEATYAIDFDVNGVVLEVLLLNSDVGVSLDLFLLDSCEPRNCLAFASGPATIKHASINIVFPGRYYIAVDGSDGQSGRFQLNVGCPGIPTPTNTPTITVEPTNTRTPTQTPTATPTPPPCIYTLERDIILGWNQLGFTKPPIGIVNAKDLVESLLDINLSVTHVANWTGNSWRIYQYPLPFNNYVLEAQNGYLVRSLSGGRWTYQMNMCE